MEKKINIKELVKLKYGEIALQNQNSSCCSSGSCCGSGEVYNIMNEDYTQLDGYNADADMGLGCGLPTQFAKIQKGNTVVDLGSGAGNDCFIARQEVGDLGQVIGIDFTPEMIAKARVNTQKRGFTNIEFREGDIENMPVDNNSVDVVVSNCVLNLLPRKDKIFHEIFRVLKPGGHFCISDVVLNGELPKALSEAAEMYVGCIAGAITQEEYLNEITKAGFQQIEIVKKKDIIIPDEILASYKSNASIKDKDLKQFKIFSITVTGKK
ncbi:arsenite methyltransferase [Bacteroides ovatus]|uniref:Arsenite methyltransferase n=1 Tax=Bacteroides ovatus TaxID=28116 RepID=A0A7J4XR98_BACOV|nr:arsenite methyltransferase [Bacteroides ovatus]KAA4634052.1 arsenite methyltransferase [Bacteroides ovatus]KAA4668605.1 arsenite methyltransferase [Bacteroides ovatus]KAA4677845.1 arsenite methyltransferase [Bacteroides ovatus]